MMLRRTKMVPFFGPPGMYYVYHLSNTVLRVFLKKILSVCIDLRFSLAIFFMCVISCVCQLYTKEYDDDDDDDDDDTVL